MVWWKRDAVPTVEDEEETPSQRLARLAQEVSHLANEVCYTARVLREERISVREQG